MTAVLPKLTIIIITLNNQRSLPECLRRIKEQDYPQELIEYINIDGGSTDDTVKIMKKYGFSTYESPIKHNAEAQRSIGLKKANNNLIISLDADNYLPTKNWIRQMVKPFIDNPEIIHAGTLHYTYNPKDTFFNRYCALYGVVDPTVFYIGKPDRLPQYENSWRYGKILSLNKYYSVIEFNLNNLPTVGCNGVVYRKDIILKYAQSDPQNFIHIDIFADLIKNGYNKFAVVNNDVIHDTAISLGSLMKKRISFLFNYNMNKNINRRYFIYNPGKLSDRIKLFLFILYTLTIIKPLTDSIKGYLKIKDIAWFAHPLMCWVYLYSYTLASIKSYAIKK